MLPAFSLWSRDKVALDFPTIFTKSLSYRILICALVTKLQKFLIKICTRGLSKKCNVWSLVYGPFAKELTHKLSFLKIHLLLIWFIFHFIEIECSLRSKYNSHTFAVSARNFVLRLDKQEINRELFEVAEIPEFIRLNISAILFCAFCSILTFQAFHV